jgi:hypothetical protein
VVVEPAAWLLTRLALGQIVRATTSNWGIRRMTKRSTQPAPNPRSAHPFQRPDDPGMSAMASGSGFTASHVRNFPTTTMFLRSTRCAVSGCGKPADDPIHWPAED